MGVVDVGQAGGLVEEFRCRDNHHVGHGHGVEILVVDLAGEFHLEEFAFRIEHGDTGKLAREGVGGAEASGGTHHYGSGSFNP